jgi:hypothetical protein
MAEDEVIKHTKKIYKLWTSKEHSIWHKISDSRMYIAIKMKYFEFIFKNEKRTSDTTSNLIPLLKTDEAFTICKALSTPAQVLSRYDMCIQLTNKILGKIDREYQ